MKNKKNKRELIKMITYVDNKEIIKEIKLLAGKMWMHEWENGLLSFDNKSANNLIMKETSHLIKQSKDKIEKLFLKLENNKNKKIINKIKWLITEESGCQYLNGRESAQISNEDLSDKQIRECSRNHYKKVGAIDKLFEKLGEKNE